MNIKEEINIKRDQIEKLQKEIETLQKICIHEEYYIGIYSWRIGVYERKQICKTCGKVLGDPTYEELINIEEDNKLIF